MRGRVFIYPVPFIFLSAASGNAVRMKRMNVVYRGSPKSPIRIVCRVRNVRCNSRVHGHEPYIRMMDIPDPCTRMRVSFAVCIRLLICNALDPRLMVNDLYCVCAKIFLCPCAATHG